MGLEQTVNYHVVVVVVVVVAVPYSKCENKLHLMSTVSECLRISNSKPEP